MWNNIYNLLFDKFFTFKDRSSRKEYILKSLLIVVFIITWNCSEIFRNNDSFLSNLYEMIIGIFGLLMFLQSLPLSIRRFHDINCSGWWTLISFIPGGQLIIFWLMLKKGTSGTNDYGDEPKY
jgi:uncharacterized membrane protein YhaH (DUF805 family)